VHAESAEYRAFWAKLGRGEHDAGQYKRVAKGGREIWLQANYSPIFDTCGRPMKVVKYASDVTAQKRQAEQLAHLVEQIGRAAREIQLSAEEIARGNSNLSQRVEEQAASLEETTASMARMTETVRENADNARKADGLALAARDYADRGGKVMGEAVVAMQAIDQSSRKIADIIGVIDAIAFQTNLLALNAAVEAARAGEQGRGFAVVATEVRSLAGRSASAAREIVESVKKVASIIGEISVASVDQASGIEQINRAVALMEEGTQQNAALVEQAAAASESIVQQVRELNSSVQTVNAGETRAATGAREQLAHAPDPVRKTATAQPPQRSRAA
jgi:methyl-accepting chemotaxis protein